MAEALSRRVFLGTAALTTAAWQATAASDKVSIGIMGTGGRGSELARAFSKVPGVGVTHLCDVDENRAQSAAAALEKAGGGQAKTVTDFRRILDEKSVDVLIVAACNHWHAPGALLGLAAGKHVYVEKPCSHNPREGELLVESAAKHKKHIQMGNQRRSYAHYIEAVKAIHEGIIGRVYLAKSFYGNNRPSIGKGVEGPAPKELNFELWQGPAPARPYRSNILHYNWHWFWHWGNGELGNNGVHSIDICRWGLGVDYPIRVTSTGGRYRFDDDQETPDTHLTSFDFEGKKSLSWEGLSCNNSPIQPGFDVLFFGEKGSMALRDGGYTTYDLKGKEVKKFPGKGGMDAHIDAFLAGVRGEPTPTTGILDAHRSTLLCHLGNIAYRLGRSLKCNPKNGHILDDAEAMKMWTREYAKGWEPKV